MGVPAYDPEIGTRSRLGVGDRWTDGVPTE